MLALRYGVSSRHIWRLFFVHLLTLFLLLEAAWGHPSPNSLVFVDVQPDKVRLEVQMPVPELELAFGHKISENPEQIVKKWNGMLREYLLAHIHAYVTKDHPWTVNMVGLKMDHGLYPDSLNSFWEVNANVELIPQNGESTRNFFLDYDVIMHQVINHVALVSVRSDWAAGDLEGKAVNATVIAWNLQENRIDPLLIDLAQGSNINGFLSMVRLGMSHILEGTDHLLFLMVLLLPAILNIDGRKWGSFAGTKKSLVKLLKIVTAFTIGHSVALIAASFSLVTFPSQPIEILIAISILVSAIHAIYPIFPGKETLVAGGFGLIHGLAFATTIAELHLTSGTLALSILGFNLGIEVMQLLIIVITIPWFLLIGKTSAYGAFRTIGALFGGIASIAWLVARSAGKENFLTNVLSKISEHPFWVISMVALICVSIFLKSESNKVKVKI